MTGERTEHDGQNGPLTIALHLPDRKASDQLVTAIQNAGYGCIALPAPATGLRAWLEHPFDALIVDPFLGWEEPAGLIGLARSIAGSRPLIILTAPDRADRRVAAFQAGCDDAVGWTDDAREILARLGGLFRRGRMAHGCIACADLRIDLIDRRVSRRDQPIRLPLREFDLLTNLARLPDRIVTRETLLRAVWRINFDPGTNRVDVHMSRLRAKVDRGFDWPMLVTARGRGYGLRSHCNVTLGDGPAGRA